MRNETHNIKVLKNLSRYLFAKRLRTFSRVRKWARFEYTHVKFKGSLPKTWGPKALPLYSDLSVAILPVDVNSGDNI